MNSPEKNKRPDIRLALIVSLTLGLAPFVPEPHIIGKIRWVWGGAVGMAPMDYFDLLLHGLPWVYLVVAVVRYFGLSEQAKKEGRS